MTAPGMSDWLNIPPADPELLDQALAGVHQIAVEAGVLEQTWRAVSMPEVCKIIADRVSYQREQVGELTAEVARLKAEMDAMESIKTVHVTSVNLQMAMVICKDEEPGTVLRETDGQRRDYVLGEDRTWTAR